MNLYELKEKALLPEQEILLNKQIAIRGVDIYLISLTKQNNRNALWLMYQVPVSPAEEEALQEEPGSFTNRDMMTNRYGRKMDFPDFHISELVIQNQRMTFTSSSSRRIDESNYESYMQLQHFMEKGFVPEKWEDVDLSAVIILTYEQDASEEFPVLDLSKDMEITLKVNKSFRQEPVNIPVHLEFGEMIKDNKFSFYDPFEMKDRFFYLDKLEHYDIWEEINRLYSGDKLQGVPEEQRRQMKEQHLSSLEKICPKGMNLAILEYESEDDIQLNFYTTEFLDERPVRSSSSSSGTLIFRSDKEPGINGHRVRLCMLKPVSRDFNGSIDAELVSWVREIPEETVKFTLRCRA